MAISNARRHWEVMQGSQMARTNRIVGNVMPDLVANHVANVANSDLNGDNTDREDTESSRSSGVASRPTSAKSLQSERDSSAGNTRPSSTTATRSATGARTDTPIKDKITISGPIDSNSSVNVDYLAELDGDTLSLYGPGALEALDKNWGIAAAGAVQIIIFKFIDFVEISKHLHKLRARFPSVHTLYFNSTNIHSLSQINALSALRRLDNLVIEADGNPVTDFMVWRSYTLFRLAHFSLRKINDVEVSAADIVNAERFFGPMAHITTSQLPQSRLLSLMGESKRKQLLNLAEDKLRKSMDVKPLGLEQRSTTESVGRAGLVYVPPDIHAHKELEQKARKDFSHAYITELTKESVMVDQKRTALRKIWPQVFLEMIQTSVLEMWDTGAYMRQCMDDLEKS